APDQRAPQLPGAGVGSGGGCRVRHRPRLNRRPPLPASRGRRRMWARPAARAPSAPAAPAAPGAGVSDPAMAATRLGAMLRRLAIRDFAVVTASELEFGPGMTVISGETGAGKSLLVDALGFLSGLRADAGMVRHGASRAELHAEFDTADAPAALAWLREQEFDEGQACTLRRTLRADGGS